MFDRDDPRDDDREGRRSRPRSRPAAVAAATRLRATVRPKRCSSRAISTYHAGANANASEITIASTISTARRAGCPQAAPEHPTRRKKEGLIRRSTLDADDVSSPYRARP
jgi:hypothetical protein